MSKETFFECCLETLDDEVCRLAKHLSKNERTILIEKALGLLDVSEEELDEFKESFEDTFAEYREQVLAAAESAADGYREAEDREIQEATAMAGFWNFGA